MAPLGPAATMVSKLMASAPASRMAISIIQETSRSVMPGTILGQTWSMALSAASIANCSIESSSKSLMMRWFSARPGAGIIETAPKAESPLMASIRLLYEETVMSWLSKPIFFTPEDFISSISQSQPPRTCLTSK